ncbi:glycosyltransferase family 4 protein [Mucilaginibacter sp.]
MDLVIDSRMINHSGIGVYLRNIIKYLIPHSNIKLLGDPDILTNLFNGLPVIPFNAKIYSVNEQLALKKTIPACDLFWSPHYNVPLATLKAKKRLVTIHDVYHLAYFNQLSIPKKIYSRLIMNAAITLSDEIITVSHFSEQEILKHTACSPKKICVIHNGVIQGPIQSDEGYVKQKYNLPDNYLLFVGNVKPHKNLKKFLQAYLLLKSDLRAKYKIVIVGKKDGFITGDQTLFNWINITNELFESIIFTGYAEDEHIDTIYKKAAAFIFPSLYEGFGLPPLEAMKNKCVVAVSDIPSMHEVCKDAALYFNPKDEQDISLKITELLINDSLRTNLINKGLSRIELFTWEQAAKQHLIAFEKTLTS